MAHFFKNLSLALTMLVTGSAAVSAHAEIVIEGIVELPYLHNHSDILGDADLPHDTLDRLGGAPSLENRLELEHGIATGGAAVSELLPVITSLDVPVAHVTHAVQFADELVATPDDPGALHTGPEPYVMALIGLGLIILALTLHLKPMQQPPRSGFKPSQGMPFV